METKILICEDCEREVEVVRSYVRKTICKECHGLFIEKEDDSDEEYQSNDMRYAMIKEPQINEESFDFEGKTKFD